MIRGVPKTKAEVRKHFEGAAGAQGGTAAGAGVSVNASQVGYTKTVLKLVDTPIVLADNAGVVAYGSLKIFDLPEGLIDIAGASCDLVLTKSSTGVIATWDGDFGLGTTAADSGAALATTEQNLIPTTATPQAVAGVANADGVMIGAMKPLLLDGTTTPVDVYLNILVDDADHDVTTTPCNIIANGTVTLTWATLGDK